MGDSYGGGGGKKVVSEELQEEDVWAMVSAREGSKTRSTGFSSSSSSSAWHVNATTRPIPRAAGRQESSPPTKAARRQASAPVDIPDWSKIMKKKSKKSLWDDARDKNNDDYGKVDAVRIDDDGGGEEEEMAPPHEYLARRLARTQIASHSMCEGVGRTLKGRDLSKVRNAILTKTGFIE